MWSNSSNNASLVLHTRTARWLPVKVWRRWCYNRFPLFQDGSDMQVFLHWLRTVLRYCFCSLLHRALSVYRIIQDSQHNKLQAVGIYETDAVPRSLNIGCDKRQLIPSEIGRMWKTIPHVIECHSDIISKDKGSFVGGILPNHGWIRLQCLRCRCIRGNHQ